MITSIPDSEQFAPVYIGDMISSKKKDDIYVFEISTNRPFRWDDYRSKRDTLDELVNMFELNIKDEKRRDKYYLYLGKSGVSEIDEENKIYFNVLKRIIKAIVESGHRTRLSFCSSLILLLFYYIKNEKLDEKLDISNYYNEFGERRMNFCGPKDDFKELYDLLSTHTVRELIQYFNKNKKDVIKIFKTTKERKTMPQILTFVYFYFCNVFENNELIKNEDPLYLHRLVSENVYMREEYVPVEQKHDFFDACNNKGLIVDLTDKIPREIVSKFEGGFKSKIMYAFEDFYAYSKKCFDEKKFINTKLGITCCEFVMDIVFKKFLLEKSIIKEFGGTAQNVYLDNENFGVSNAIKKYGFCETPEDAMNFFKECYNVCDFIYHSMDNNMNLHNTYFMFRKEDGNERVVWWYCILPLFVMNQKCKNERIRRYVYDYLCKMKAFQHSSKKAKRGTNTQAYINNMFVLTAILLRNNEEEIPNELQKFSKSWTNSLPKPKLKNALTRYVYEFDKEDIQRILKWNEFIFIEKNKLPHDTLYRFFTDKTFEVNFDHIIPVNQYNDLIDNDDKESDNSKIGNFAIIEASLNKSKGDKLNKNSTHYKESGFYLTSLLNENSRKNLSNKQLESIDFERYDEEKLNSFSTSDVDKRTIYLVDSYVDWIYDLTYEDEGHSEATTEVVYAEIYKS